MSTQPQYANIVHTDSGLVTTGDASRTAPTNFSSVLTAGQNSSRIDRLLFVAIGATIASTVRLFDVLGSLGVAIASITFSGTTATVTTVTPHGLATGQTVSMRGAFPLPYNVKNAAITVVNGTTFTYAMGSAPPANALLVGYYTAFPASPTWILWDEIPVSAVTPSGTVQVFSTSLSSAQNAALMPHYLPAGWELRASVNDTQTASGINVIACAGDF